MWRGRRKEPVFTKAAHPNGLGVVRDPLVDTTYVPPSLIVQSAHKLPELFEKVEMNTLQ